jgi:cytoplasmic iron level regulating protein YaaA (DUF328/UPF0246 family)
VVRPVVLLVPPSEGKAPGGTGAWTVDAGRFPDLADARDEVARALAEAMRDAELAARISGLQGPRGAQARQANAGTVGGPVLPAWRRYSGVVWAHLDPATLRGPIRRRAATVLVVSALGGLFAFEDPVPDYKCSIGKRLPGIGGLSAYWRRHTAAALVEACDGAIVWDLLPGEHRSAVDLSGCGARRIIRVEPRTSAGGAVGHDAKAVKGSFARHILESGAAAVKPAVVSAFVRPGWSATIGADVVTLLQG